MRRIPQRTMYKISVVCATKISPEFNFNVVVCNVCLCFSQKFIGFCTSKSQINSNYSMTEPMRPTCNRKQMSPEIRCRADKDVVEDKKRDWATECNAIMSETVKNTTKVTTVHKLFENLVANLLHQYRHDEVRARVRQTECRKNRFEPANKPIEAGFSLLILLCPAP